MTKLNGQKKKRVEVCCCILMYENKILILKRNHTGPRNGLWEFPGGKIENETPIDCTKRELKEELSIDAVVGDLYCCYTYKYPHVSYELYFYKIISFKGEPTKSVHDKLKWERLENFNKYDFLPGDDPVIEKLISDN